jgi:ubiquinone/menaquinone biosynthesis C-methylase UbiE
MKAKIMTIPAIFGLILIAAIFIETNLFSNKGDISKPSAISVRYHILLTSTLMHSFYKNYFDNIHFEGNEKVMDFGSGWGTEAKILAEKLLKNGSVTCLDISPVWIETSRKRLAKFKNVDFIMGDVTKLNIPESSYNVIIIHIVLHDIDIKYRNEIIHALQKILKPGGKLYIREPLSAERCISLSGISELMKKNGLKELSLKSTKSFWMGNLVEGIFEK